MPTGACRMCVVDVEGFAQSPHRLLVPGGRRHEGEDAFAARPRNPANHRAAAPGQSPRRLPLLRAQLELRPAGPGARPRHLPPRVPRLPRQEEPGRLGARRWCAIRRSASCAASACGCARTSSSVGHRLRRPRQQDRDRHRVLARAGHLELHQLRSVRGGVPDRRSGRALLRARGAGAPCATRTSSWSCSTHRRSRSPWPRSSAFQPGTDCDGQMVAALRRAGFKRVFDTSFTADLTIMEEASELVQRITDRRQAAHVHQLLARLDQVHGRVLPGHAAAPVHLQEPAADAGRGHQELLRPARRARSSQASSACPSCRARPRSSRPAGPRWPRTTSPTWTTCSPRARRLSCCA